MLSSSLLLAGPIDSLAKASRTIYTKSVNQKQVNIMYSNDICGAVNSTAQGFGGLKSLQTTINNELVSTLLLDAGGFLNFNRNNHTETIQWMNKVGYHAVNLSAADLKQGIDAFANLLPQMAFDLLSCNYHFEDHKVQKAVKSYQVITYGKYRVGVTGVGETTQITGLKVSDPVVALNNIAKYLKEVEACDLVVCLSHLGFSLDAEENNHNLAASSAKVDLVIGGNTKTGRSLLRIIRNTEKEEVLLGQNYNAAQSVSQVTLEFNVLKKKTLLDLKQRVPGADQSLHVSESLSLIKPKHSKYNT
ncbi:Trifunctional nucleotide phosphoesterase protein YfkN precursor [compost metagenome]